MIDSLIGNMGIIETLCKEVIEESMMEGIEHYVVENIFLKAIKEGSELVA